MRYCLGIVLKRIWGCEAYVKRLISLALDQGRVTLSGILKKLEDTASIIPLRTNCLSLVFLEREFVSKGLVEILSESNTEPSTEAIEEQVP